jgi:hypothetical protein
LFDRAPTAPAWGGGGIPPGKVRVIFDDGGDFVKFYNSMGKEGCEIETEICINTKGELSVGFECDGLGFEVSTSGDVKITAGGVTAPLRKGN